MIEVIFSNSFLRKVKKLGNELQVEVVETVGLLKNKKNHPKLKVHKLHGKFSDYISCRVNYEFRIVYRYLSKNTIILEDVGNHSVYK